MQHEGNVDMFRASETFPRLFFWFVFAASKWLGTVTSSAEEQGRVIGLYRCDSFTCWKGFVWFYSVLFFYRNQFSIFSELFKRRTSCLSCDVGRFLIFYRFQGNIFSFPPLFSATHWANDAPAPSFSLSLSLFTTVPEHFFSPFSSFMQIAFV